MWLDRPGHVAPTRKVIFFSFSFFQPHFLLPIVLVPLRYSTLTLILGCLHPHMQPTPRHADLHATPPCGSGITVPRWCGSAASGRRTRSGGSFSLRLASRRLLRSQLYVDPNRACIASLHPLEGRSNNFLSKFTFPESLPRHKPVQSERGREI